MTEHRWSGHPGAWCLDCGRDDPMELALADGTYDALTGEFVSEEAKAQYDFSPCPEPGSNRCNPYVNRRNDDQTNPQVIGDEVLGEGGDPGA